MSDVSELVNRIEGALTTVKDKIEQQQKQMLKEHQERQQRLKDYEVVQAKIVELAKPRLEALAKKAGDRVQITPSVSQTRRSARFEFRSAKAYITLTFTVTPDRSLKNAAIECDLKIVPVLWTFDSHSEFVTPVAAPDYAAATRWLDDRIVAFVELYIQIHEGEFYDKAEYVEDPVTKVKFPKFAAGATLEHGGKTIYFIDDNSKQEFTRQQRTA
jgi:hypothetical protein